MQNDYIVINFNEKDYEIRYTFDLIRKIKAYGVSLPDTFVNVTKGGGDELFKNSSIYIDEIIDIISALLRSVGCKEATPEAVHNHFTQQSSLIEATGLIMWLGTQYYHISKAVKVEEPEAKKPVAKKKKKAPVKST